MSRPSALVLPDHAEILAGPDGLVVRHAGDVVLEQTLGRRLARIEAGGDVTLRRARFHGSVRAGGAIRLDAPFDGEDLRGDVVEIGAVSVQARAVVARTRVVVGAATLAVDVIVAPEVRIDPSATGRVRVVDCLNDRPPTKVRGCLSLEDYEADFGDVAGFLARLDVQPVSPLPGAADEEDADALEETAQIPAVRGFGAAARDFDGFDPVAGPPADPWVDDDTVTDDGSVADDASVADAVVEFTGDHRVDVSEITEELPESHLELVEDAEALGEASVTTFDDTPARPVPGPSRVARQVERAWDRMRAAYPPDALPEGVARVGALLSEGRAEEVPDRIDDLWVATLREHLLRGAPPPRSVVLAFHALRAARTAA